MVEAEELKALSPVSQVDDAGLVRVQFQPQICQRRHHQLPRLDSALLNGAERRDVIGVLINTPSRWP